ncbi:hypothetical protein BH11BAC3_BH11BAC3_02130 [soil metagenome]
MKIILQCIVLFAIILTFGSCKTHPRLVHINRAFYFWKSNEYSLNENELKALKNLKINKLYVKFFEVEPDVFFGTKPTAKTTIHIWSNYDLINKDTILEKAMSGLEIIPTVFIKNLSLINHTHAALDSLADNIVFLTNKMYKENIRNNKGFNELQIDCDWTAKTKDNYFYLLVAIRKLSGKKLSCTLRLYPYKYPEIMGVPPVDKAMLMCYNLDRPLDNDDKNSILESGTLKKYLNVKQKYPLHLDIALPVFSWMQVYQNQQFASIINGSKDELPGRLLKIKPLWYEVQQEMTVDGIFLKEGDLVKNEEVSETAINECVSLLKKNVQLDDSFTITLFHLDDKNLEKYSHETLLKFYTDFNN